MVEFGRIKIGTVFKFRENDVNSYTFVVLERRPNSIKTLICLTTNLNLIKGGFESEFKYAITWFSKRQMRIKAASPVIY